MNRALREGPDMTGEGVQFGVVDQNGLEAKVLRLGEGLPPPEDPPGDDPGWRWPSRDEAW
ncbi:hypothetical protein [Streptomyces atroolivaceus]|uniref:hypothetical protein n=1 Tax=Streptomyces atroolivaceus TaxID=66869 RepID=UPI00363EAC43